jgi:hypothetical protein
MSMARRRRHQGKRQEANELLAPVYGWFTEGFDMRHLQGAAERVGVTKGIAVNVAYCAGFRLPG